MHEDDVCTSRIEIAERGVEPRRDVRGPVVCSDDAHQRVAIRCERSQFVAILFGRDDADHTASGKQVTRGVDER